MNYLGAKNYTTNQLMICLMHVHDQEIGKKPQLFCFIRDVLHASDIVHFTQEMQLIVCVAYL